MPEAPSLELLFEARIDLEPPQDIGETPFGRRIVFIVRGGTFEGPRLRGTFLPAAETGISCVATAPASWTSVRRSGRTMARSC